MKSNLTNLPNIGAALAQELENIGITSKKQLIETGSIDTIIQLNISNIHACINKLFAIEGAIRGIRWHDIPKQEREHLKEKYLSLSSN